MILGVSSYITSAGLKSVTSAGALGPYFAIKYFLPIYNFRIDKTICRGPASTSALNISAMNLVSATDISLNASFEKIFNGAVYDITSNNQYIYYDTGMTNIGSDGAVSTNVNSRQSISTNVNTLNGAPISHVVSGSNFYTTGNGLFNISGTKNINALAFDPTSGSNPPISAYYRVTSYSPKQNGVTSASGAYKCRIPAGTGSFKFNGLALYGTKVDSNGFDDNGMGVSNFGFKPTLIAVVLFDEAQIKNDAVGAINDFEIKVDLGFDWSAYGSPSSLPTYIETNYWNKLPTASTTSAYGINYDGDVVIASSAIPGSWTPRAKLTITDPTKQQLRLSNSELRFADITVKRHLINGNIDTNGAYDLSVLNIDTGCPDDSLLELGYKTSAYGIKSIAMGCNALAGGYNVGQIVSAFENNLLHTAGGFTTSIGIDTSALGFNSFAIGNGTLAKGNGCFVGGYESISTNEWPGNYTPESSTGFNFSYGYKTSAISTEDTCNSTPYGDASYGGDRGANISIGQETLAYGSHTIALGHITSAIGTNAIAIGQNNTANDCHTIAFGAGNLSTYGTGSMSLGISNSASYGSIVIGTLNYGNGSHAIAMGYEASATDKGAIALGTSCYDSGDKPGPLASGMFSIAIGGGAYAESFNSIAMGFRTYSKSSGSIAIGHQSFASSDHAIALGFRTSATANHAFAIGQESIAMGNTGFSMGYKTSAGANSVVFGNTSIAEYGSYAFGNSVSAKGGSYAFGYNLTATGNNTFTFGRNSSNTGDESYILGSNITLDGYNSIAMGKNIKSDGTNNITIGYNITATGTDTITIGSCSTAKSLLGGQNIVIGGSCTNSITLDSDNIKITAGLRIPKLRIFVSQGPSSMSLGVNLYNSKAGDWKFSTNTEHGFKKVNNSMVIENNKYQYVSYAPNINAASVWVGLDTGTVYLLNDFFIRNSTLDTALNDIKSIIDSNITEPIVCVMDRNYDGGELLLSDYISYTNIYHNYNNNHAFNVNTASVNYNGTEFIVTKHWNDPMTIAAWTIIDHSGGPNTWIYLRNIIGQQIKELATTVDNGTSNNRIYLGATSTNIPLFG